MMRRQAVQPQIRSKMAVKTFPSPVGGWVSSAPLSSSGVGTARVLENWFPTQTGVRPRAGTKKRATIGSPVVSMFTYSGGGIERIFAASTSSVFNISSVVDLETPPVATVTGQTNGYYSTSHLSNVAGTHFYACNGFDKPLYYDGTSFVKVDAASTPAITGVTTSDLLSVFTYANRLYFIKKNSLIVHYLAIDAIGGAVQTLTLAGAFTKGGSLVYGASWSMDAGDGLDDKAVFMSDQGQIAVAEGTDPSDPNAWRIVGVYDVGIPLGRKAFFRVGGELMILTVDGIIPLSQATQGDKSRLSLSSVARGIEPDWRNEVQARSTKPIEALKWVEGNMLFISQPEAFDGQTRQALVGNLQTGAWCKFTGINTDCLGLYQGRAFFGTKAGTVHEFEAAGNDDGSLYVCRMALWDDPLSDMASVKTVKQARATFRATHDVTASLGASTDYALAFASPPSSIANFVTSLWDVGLWDDALWDTGRGEYMTKTTKWRSIGVTGYSFTVTCQITMGITPAPDAELITIDVTYEGGGVVV